MTLSEFEKKKIEKVVARFVEERRPAPHIRPQLDVGFRLSDRSVEIFEIRPRWDKPEEKIESPVAKATYVKSRGVWKIFWMRADLKWHSYPPAAEVKSVEQFLALVDEDENGCFFG
jgi:hypothetical protein